MADTTQSTGEESIREYDRIPVRTLGGGDLDAMVRIDARIVGRSRRDYLSLKLQEALHDTRIQVSLGAEVDGSLAGFLMGRLYYGEFGSPEPLAILDTIGVDPARRGTGVAQALLEQFKRNLRAVGIETIQTQADWNAWELLRFLGAAGFTPAPRIVLEAPV
jgi:GNAT superfamily N-acetyltransferase